MWRILSPGQMIEDKTVAELCRVELTKSQQLN